MLGSSDHDNESSGAIKGREHLEQLNSLQIALLGISYQTEAVMV